MLMGKLGNYYK